MPSERVEKDSARRSGHRRSPAILELTARGRSQLRGEARGRHGRLKRRIPGRFRFVQPACNRVRDRRPTTALDGRDAKQPTPIYRGRLRSTANPCSLRGWCAHECEGSSSSTEPNLRARPTESARSTLISLRIPRGQIVLLLARLSLKLSLRQAETGRFEPTAAKSVDRGSV